MFLLGILHEETERGSSIVAHESTSQIQEQSTYHPCEPVVSDNEKTKQVSKSTATKVSVSYAGVGPEFLFAYCILEKKLHSACQPLSGPRRVD